MTEFQPLTKTSLLEKFSGKGGWTYISFPEIRANKNSPFGMMKVKGKIDDLSFKNARLMPKGDGTLFLPINAKMRKQINKQAGDQVIIALEIDDSPVEITDELLECFANEPAELLQKFRALKEGEQKAYLAHIYNAKTEDTKVERIVQMMESLSR